MTAKPLEQLIVEQLVSEYIDNQRCVLWGEFYDIRSKEGNKRAKEFILDILIDLGISYEMVDVIPPKKKKKRR